MCKRVTFVLAGSLGPVGMVDESDSGRSTTEAGTGAKGASHDSENGSHEGEAITACNEGQNPRRCRGLSQG